MKSNFDKWLVLDSDEYYNHILFKDISAFQRAKNKNEIRIFLKGNYLPLVFGFANPETVDAAMDVMVKNLSPNDGEGFVKDCLETIIEAEE